MEALCRGNTSLCLFPLESALIWIIRVLGIWTLAYKMAATQEGRGGTDPFR